MAERRDEAHHHTGARSTSVDAHYDFLREAGYSRVKAREWAERATDKFVASQEGESKPASPRSNVPASRRFVTPHFGEFAGRLCVVHPDGRMEPIG